MPSLSTVKASSIKVFFKDFGLGEVFAVRSKRNRRTQCSSTTHHEGHDADIPMHSGSLARDSGLQVSIDISSATASHGDSFARTTSDVAQTFLPVIQAIASAIPIAGPPMQAAIGGLLSILQIIDRRNQNQADLNRLRERLQRLSSHLCNAPTAQNPSEQDRRNSIIRILQETSAQLTKLQKRRPEHASVTQAITGCSIEIDRYLLESLWSFQMESHCDTHQGSAIRWRQQDSVGSTTTQLPAAATLGCVKLVDATGYEHAISVTCCTSFQQLNKMLQVLFECKSVEARIQRQYMEQGQYDLCIDDDKQVTRLTSHEWPRIEAGTTIVMRIVFEEEIDPQVEYQCYMCGAVNRIDSLQCEAGCSINCQICKRRFQISHEFGSKPKIQSSIDYTEAETHLIRNFHVQQTRSASRPVYKCQLQGNPCGLYVEGTTSAMSAHLRRHGITGPDSISTICTWGGCSKTLRKGSMIRHLLTHLGVKARCSACGVVKCRNDLLRAHIKSSEPCQAAVVDHVHGPEGRLFIPSGSAAATHEVVSL